MRITISGTPGSGKSTIAKGLAAKLRLKHYSMGDFQRMLANERGLTIKEWGELEKTDPTYDRMVDDRQIRIGKEEDGFVLDSRLGAKFIPHAIKIWVDAKEDTRIKRRLSQARKEESFRDRESAKKDMREREEGNRERFLKFYSFDFLDLSNYDIVIDTTDLGPEESVKKALEEVKALE